LLGNAEGHHGIIAASGAFRTEFLEMACRDASHRSRYQPLGSGLINSEPEDDNGCDADG